MRFELTILGCGAATPTLKRNPTSQLVNVHDKYYLIDCGEGTQVQLRKHKFRFQRISHIFISHLHGDHYLGLLGLLSSMHLLGRATPLHIYGPADLKEIIHVNLKFSQTYLCFEWIFHPLNMLEGELIMETDKLWVRSFPMNHRIDCCGYVFEEKPKRRRILKEAIESRNLNIAEIVQLKDGKNVARESGEVLDIEECTLPPYPSRKYVYCSDTAPFDGQIDIAKNADLLYHESTFANQHEQRAKETFHSTAAQAATVASEAHVKHLLLGHFSSRYTDLSVLEEEAKEIFPNTQLAHDGLSIEI
ncbi:MAG: ribonuclease Z [Flavobacteriales bacterium]|nr:ribonuclease Z [Flavobacteriales bacterium]